MWPQDLQNNDVSGTSSVIGLDLTGLDGIRMDFGWIRSVLEPLLDRLDHCPKIQLGPYSPNGRSVT